jgi:methionine-S-sulfoxide reductase
MPITQTALFALGCFWEPDNYFSALDGITKTTVGYSGGSTKNPTYEDLGDHTETIRIEFDPAVITYQELLRHFWDLHDPTKPRERQYRSAIFFLDSVQRKIAEGSKKDEQKKHKSQIYTQILKATAFTQAERYHQKYLQKMKRIRNFFFPA